MPNLKKATLETIPEPTGRIFAVGDIHGCFRQLKILLEALDKEAKADDVFVFIGDYIDRGPNSCAVIDALCEWKREYTSYFLRGNHEEMFMQRLGLGGSDGEWFITNGGAETLRSYNLNTAQLYEASNDIHSYFPLAHIEFFKELKYGIQTNRFIFVHAGINPYTDLDHQTVNDFVWIREEFLDAPAEMFDEVCPGKIIVHGHTRTPQITFDRPRINLDTACFRTDYDEAAGLKNALSCVELTAGEIFSVQESSLLLTRIPFSEYNNSTT